MVTKLKNISYSMFLKAIAFILAVACLTSGLTIFVYLSESTNTSWEVVFKDNYLESDSLRHELGSITSDLTRFLKHYKSEDYIKNGGTLSKDIYDYSWEIRNLYSDFKNDFYRDNSEEYDSLPKKELMAKFEKEYAEEIKLYKNKYINNELNNYLRLAKRINNIAGLHYYISSGEDKYTNTSNKSKEFFNSQPVYLLFDENGYVTSLNSKGSYWYYTNEDLSYYPQDIVYAALSNEFLTPKITQWNKDKNVIMPKLALIALSIIGFIICMIYLILTCGRQANDKEVHLLAIDKLYLDVNIIVTLSLVAICIALAGETFRELEYLSFIPLAALCSMLSINLFLTLIKHIKNRTIVKHNLCYRILRKLLLFPKKLLMSAPIAVKMVPTPNKANDLKNIIEGVDHIKNGELNYEIRTSSKGIYSDLADDINSITDGLKAAVNNEIKSERLKTELISNVSHDIRTPLTSIITYIDLLKNEGLNSKDAEKYLDVLDQKSLRLKTLTDDLFEASKASSGSIPVTLEKVDITSLLTQCMGELNSKIVSSGLDFQFNYPKEKVFVKADGRLLWRVIENLMSNIFKYALKNTRVYIDVVHCDNSVSIILKNISAYRLNINEDELMERFARGDESRTSEGSGLGLSIAKSLVELQNGKFDITIDGDLFKVIVTIPRYEE